MSMEQTPEIDFTVDTANLYKEESLTDLKVASIRKLTPIKIDGSEDSDRKPVFYGHTQLMSAQGPVPIQAQLEADTLEDAIKIFPEAMKKGMEELFEKYQKMAEQQQQKDDSRIIVPGR